MSKFIIRITILLVALYMIICHIAAVVWQINLWSHTYTVLFELCVCLCISAQGVYHCRFMKWTAYSVCLNDAIVSADEIWDFMPYTLAAVLPLIIITLGLLTTTTLAIRHFIKVKKYKHRWENPNHRF